MFDAQRANLCFSDNILTLKVKTSHRRRHTIIHGFLRFRVLLNKPNGAGAAPEFRCDLIRSLTSPCFLSIMRTLAVIKLENNISGCVGLEFRRIREFAFVSGFLVRFC